MNALVDMFGPGFHQPAIEAAFAGRTRFEGDAPVIDRPLILMGFTNRCGSSLLGTLLAAQPGLGGFGESLNADLVARIAGRHAIPSFPDFIVRVIGRRARGVPSAAIGLKAAADQITMLLRWRIDRMFPGVRLLHVQRADVVAQAVSYAIALQTGQWTSEQPRREGAVPAYDFGQICRIVHDFARADRSIALTAAVSGLPYLRVLYEDVAAAPAREVARIMAWAGLPFDGAAVPPRRLHKQADDLSAEFVRRFAEDFRAAQGLPEPRALAPAT